MKNILFIIALSVAGLGYAQIPQITDAQLENSRVIKEKTDKFNAIVDQKVDQIMDLANVDTKKRSELYEIMLDKESQIALIDRENLSDIMKQSKLLDVRNAFETKLKEFLGEGKYVTVQNALNPR